MSLTLSVKNLNYLLRIKPIKQNFYCRCICRYHSVKGIIQYKIPVKDGDKIVNYFSAQTLSKFDDTIWLH